jgi:hypothetical protein
MRTVRSKLALMGDGKDRRCSTCPWILASATSPFTGLLRASLAEELSSLSQAFLAASFQLGVTKPLRPNLFRAVRSDAAFVLVEFVLMLPIVAFNDRYFLLSQSGEPADDLVVGATSLEVRNQVVNRNLTRGKARSSRG